MSDWSSLFPKTWLESIWWTIRGMICLLPTAIILFLVRPKENSKHYEFCVQILSGLLFGVIYFFVRPIELIRKFF